MKVRGGKGPSEEGWDTWHKRLLKRAEKASKRLPAQPCLQNAPPTLPNNPSKERGRPHALPIRCTQTYTYGRARLHGHPCSHTAHLHMTQTNTPGSSPQTTPSLHTSLGPATSGTVSQCLWTEGWRCSSRGSSMREGIEVACTSTQHMHCGTHQRRRIIGKSGSAYTSTAPRSADFGGLAWRSGCTLLEITRTHSSTPHLLRTC